MVVFPVLSAVFVYGKFLGHHEGRPPWSRTANFLLRKLHRGKRFLKTSRTSEMDKIIKAEINVH